MKQFATSPTQQRSVSLNASNGNGERVSSRNDEHHQTPL